MGKPFKKEIEQLESKYLKDEEYWKDYLKDTPNPVSLKTISKKINSNSNRYIDPILCN